MATLLDLLVAISRNTGAPESTENLPIQHTPVHSLYHLPARTSRFTVIKL